MIESCLPGKVVIIDSESSVKHLLVPDTAEAYRSSCSRYAPRFGRRPERWGYCFAVRVLRRLLCDLIRKRKEGTT